MYKTTKKLYRFVHIYVAKQTYLQWYLYNTVYTCLTIENAEKQYKNTFLSYTTKSQDML